MIAPESPNGLDIKSLVREMLEEELTLDIQNPGGQLVIRMMLDGKAIGKSRCIYNEVNYIGDDELDVEFKVD